MRFADLWESHPTVKGESSPCETAGIPNFSNQCAIRMGVALQRAGIQLSKLPGAMKYCWHHDRHAGHILVAEELARSLESANITQLKPVIKFDAKDFVDRIGGKRGIVLFKDYWLRAGEAFDSRSGDHIDLWNGSRLTEWTSWVRIHLRLGNIGLHSVVSGVSDLEDAKAIWFWEVH